MNGSASTFRVSSFCLFDKRESGCCCCCCWQTWVGLFINSGSEYIEVEGDRSKAAVQVFIAAGLYGLTFALSLFFWIRALMRARQYDRR